MSNWSPEPWEVPDNDPSKLRCECDGCWACSGHEEGCTCDVDWDAITEERMGK